MSDETKNQPQDGATPAKPGNEATPPAVAPAQPVDTQAQEEAGQERAEGGGYT